MPNKSVSSTVTSPVDYIKDYYELYDVFMDPSNPAYDSSYSNISKLRSKIISDMKQLDDYGNTTGATQSKLNEDYGKFFLLDEMNVVSYSIGIIILLAYTLYYFKLNLW
jgi:hypothetical protein